MKVNNCPVEVAMRVGKAGEAYFVHDMAEDLVDPSALDCTMTSPLITPAPARGSEEGRLPTTRQDMSETESELEPYDERIQDWKWG